MQDIPAIAEVAHARGIPVLADNTWGTPYYFRSFERGVDVSIHAGTKYIAGHSDVMMGLITTNERYWLQVRRAVANFGYGVSPDGCFPGVRRFRTIGVRKRQQMANALKVARWLEERSDVKRLLYPALENDPGHQIWKRDFDGAASLFSFVLIPVSKQATTAFVDALELFGIGSAWGGHKSLLPGAYPQRVGTAPTGNPGGPTIRVHIGLEDPDDLIADLDAAFAAMRRA